MIEIDIVLEDEFVITEYSGIADLARVSNRILGQEKFTWDCYSQVGGIVTSGSGAFVDTKPIPQNPTCDYVVFLGNRDPFYKNMDVVRFLPRYSYAGAKIILLAEAASRYIISNRKNALDHTTHWENRVLLEEQRGIFGIKSEFSASRGNIITSAGMASTADTMLAILAKHISAAKLGILTNIFLNETIRPSATLQTETREVGSLRSEFVINAVNIMRENIEDPLSIAAISRMANISSRSLERSFKVQLGCSPSVYYREIRLNLAHNLLMNSDLRTVEIAIACGFGTGFSSAYKKVFGRTPHAARRLIRSKQTSK